MLLTWSGIWFWVLARHGGLSWHYFADSGRIFEDVDSGSGGLHLYATRPDLQFGPVSVMAAAALLEWAGSDALLVAQVGTAALGGLVLVVIRQLAIEVRPLTARSTINRSIFLASLAFIPVWMDLAARFVHIDDIFALALTVVATLLLRRHQWLFPAILLALAVDAKPWALPFVALLIIVDRPSRLRALVVYAGCIAVAWIPFLVSDPRTFGAASFRIPVDPSSALYLLGVGNDGTPSWVRLVQIALGVTLALLAIRRGRWPAAVLLVVLARLVVDPGVHSYYAAGVVVGAVLWDLAGSTRRLPIWSLASAAAFFAIRWIPQPPWLHGVLTIAFFLTAAALLAVRPGERSDLGPARSSSQDFDQWTASRDDRSESANPLELKRTGSSTRATAPPSQADDTIPIIALPIAKDSPVNSPCTQVARTLGRHVPHQRTGSTA